MQCRGRLLGERRQKRSRLDPERRSVGRSLDAEHAELVDERGVQIAPLNYPHLSHTEIFASVEEFYRQFYFRAPKIAAIVGEMVTSPQMMRRRLREGVDFFQFLRERNRAA